MGNAAATPRVFFAPLESFRGIAALLVAWFHSSIVAGSKPLLIAPANIYVDFFFVLSGFVMMHAYASRIRDGMGLYRFAALRLARLWPLHMVMLLAFLAYDLAQHLAMTELGFGNGARAENTSFAFVMNALLVHGFGTMDALTFNYPSWSISAEFWTYLLFFAVIWAGFARRYAVALVLSAAGFAALAVIAARTGGSVVRPDYAVFRCVAGFFAGAAVYGLYLRLPLRGGFVWLTSLEIGAVTLAAALVALSTDSAAFQCAAIGSFVLLIYVFSNGSGALGRVLGLAPFRLLGRVSFSIYMIHAFVLMLAGVAARRVFDLPQVPLAGRGAPVSFSDHAALINLGLLALIVALSWVSWRVVEQGGQRLLRRVLLPDVRRAPVPPPLGDIEEAETALRR